MLHDIGLWVMEHFGYTNGYCVLFIIAVSFLSIQTGTIMYRRSVQMTLLIQRLNN